MTLTELSAAWNDLRNAALGRGEARPIKVPLALGLEVGIAYEEWRAYLASRGPLESAIPELQWLEKYRALAAKVKAAGVNFEAPPATLLEQAAALPGQAAGALGHTVQTIAIAFGAVVLPLGLLWLLNRGRR
jgi:hypothetical protein